jgi:hypothetical protein
MTRIIDPIIEKPVEEKPIAEVSFELADEFTIRRTRPEVTQAVSRNFDLNFLLEQRIAITRQRDEMISLKTAELAEVEELITKAGEAGVKSRKSTEEASTPAEPV